MNGKSDKAQNASARKENRLSPAPSRFAGFCPIAPVPKGRPRFNSRTRTTYTPAKTEKYERAVRKWMIEQYGRHREPMDGAIRARYEFVLERPASIPKKRWFSNTKPDIDNFEKSFQDALDFKEKSRDDKPLGVIANDSRVAVVSATKRYAREGEEPGVYFSFERVDTAVVLMSDNVSEDMAALIDPGYRRIMFSQLKDAKADGDIVLVYAVFSGEDKEFEKKLVELVEKKFPNAERMVMI